MEFIRRNAIALLALFFALTGTGIAASRYVITSTSQIKPSVLAKIRSYPGPRGATGVLGAEGREGREGRAGQSGPEGKVGREGTSATPLWARVSSQGVFVTGSGVVSVHPRPVGGYEVEFDRNVGACAYEATIGSAAVSAENTELERNGAGEILVEPLEYKVDAVYVETLSREGKAEDKPFHLAVFC